MKQALFISRNLLGDALYISQALNTWHLLHLDYEISILTNYDYVRYAYEGMLSCPVRMYYNEELIENVKWDFVHTFDVNAAFKLCDEKKIHVSEAYGDLLGVDIRGEGLFHYHPLYLPPKMDVPSFNENVILVSMFSASCSSRQGQPPNKMLPWEKWAVILDYLRSLDIPLRFLGGPDDSAPLQISEEEYVRAIPLPLLANVMRKAKCLITVDNGMSHLAASQKTPTYLFYPRCLGTHYILPKGNPYLRFVHMDPLVLSAAEAVRDLRWWLHVKGAPQCLS